MKAFLILGVVGVMVLGADFCVEGVILHRMPGLIAGLGLLTLLVGLGGFAIVALMDLPK